MIGMARAFFSNPNYGELLAQGRGEEITPCLWCNKCHGTILADKPDPWLSVCSVNPRFASSTNFAIRLLKNSTGSKRGPSLAAGPWACAAPSWPQSRGIASPCMKRPDIWAASSTNAESYSFSGCADFKTGRNAAWEELGGVSPSI